MSVGYKQHLKWTVLRQQFCAKSGDTWNGHSLNRTNLFENHADKVKTWSTFMTFSLKDLTKYSGFLAIGFIAIAILQQPPNALSWPHSLYEDGGAKAAFGFVLSVLFAYVIVGVAWGFRYVDHVCCNNMLIPLLAGAFFAFGLTILCKFESVDPFQSVHPFWRLGSLAYGAFLVDVAVAPNKPPYSAQ